MIKFPKFTIAFNVSMASAACSCNGKKHNHVVHSLFKKWKIGNRVFWSQFVDSEYVPEDIDNNGDMKPNPWVSKYKKHIDRQNTEKTAIKLY